MMDKTVRDTVEMLDESIKTLNKKKDLTPSDLETMCKAYHLKMDIEDFYSGGEYGYDDENQMSRDYPMHSYGYGGRMSHKMPHYPMEYMMDDRYSNTMRSPVTGRYISRDDGMSGHSVKERIIAKLEHMYDEAADDREREEIRKEIRAIESGR